MNHISWALRANHRAQGCSPVFEPGPRDNSTKYDNSTHFTDEDTEAPRGYANCPKLPDQWELGLKFQARTTALHQLIGPCGPPSWQLVWFFLLASPLKVTGSGITEPESWASFPKPTPTYGLPHPPPKTKCSKRATYVGVSPKAPGR